MNGFYAFSDQLPISKLLGNTIIRKLGHRPESRDSRPKGQNSILQFGVQDFNVWDGKVLFETQGASQSARFKACDKS